MTAEPPRSLGLFLGLALLLAWQPAGAEESGLEFFAPPFQKWEKEAQAIRITDLSVAKPADALSAKREKGKWKVIPYSTASFSGQALITGPETDAAQVEIPLAVKGWYAISIGVSNVARGAVATDDGIWARVSGDSGWHRMRNTLPLAVPRREVIEEVYLGIADLTGKNIQFKQMPFVNGALMSVRLVPLTSQEVTLYQEYMAKNPYRHMIATFDAHGMIWENRPRTADDLRTAFDGFDESDFGKWWYQVGCADLTHYPTKVGTIIGSQTQDYVRWEDREYAQTITALLKNGINPLKEARDIARENHAEFHVFVRPSGWLTGIPWEENFMSRFAMAHKEWRCVDRDGTPTLFMSYAVPEVRKQIVDILRETLEFQPDGVGLLFHRGLPLVLWEEPFVKAYQAKYGKDPHSVPEEDPTIGEMRGEILTSLIKEIRAMLDETAKSQGRTTPYKISLATFSTEADNKKFGIEVEQWIKDKLVDGDIAPCYFADHTSFAAADLSYYKRITQGTGVGLYPMYRAYKPGKPNEFLKKQLDAYKAGATGIGIWDPAESYTWAGIKTTGQPAGQTFDFFRFLGHRKLLEKWGQGGMPAPRVFPLTHYGDNYYSRWFPGTGL
ncbi:hypothetical protein BH09VER1_BH09VER1_36030 [soil metagenome]